MQFINTGVVLPTYKLVTYNRYWEVLTTRTSHWLPSLAEAAYRNSWWIRQNRSSFHGFSSHEVHQEVFSPKGRLLNTDELVSWGAKLSTQWRLSSYMRGYVRRGGTVPGISGWRGGPPSKPCRSQQERRVNALVLREEGEVPARPSRCGAHLPDSWDGRYRDTQRCWKVQHKGRKSWDRK